jgi:hypothetical protein
VAGGGGQGRRVERLFTLFPLLHCVLHCAFDSTRVHMHALPFRRAQEGGSVFLYREGGLVTVLVCGGGL